jgi:hypothetical protein
MLNVLSWRHARYFETKHKKKYERLIIFVCGVGIQSSQLKFTQEIDLSTPCGSFWKISLFSHYQSQFLTFPTFFFFSFALQLALFVQQMHIFNGQKS